MKHYPKTCPICGKVYAEYPAVSRKDNKTEICPQCGIAEALEAYFRMKESQTKEGQPE